MNMGITNDKPGVKTNSEWKCSSCGKFSNAAASSCPHCGLAKKRIYEDTNRDNTPWKCNSCGKFNDASARVCQYCGPTDSRFNSTSGIEDSINFNSKLESNTLRIIATIVLVVGIISSFILLVIGASLTTISGVWDGMGTILAIIPVLLGSIVTWALLRVFANLSTDVATIKERLNNR